MNNYKFSLSNFRVFDENGTEFDIAPITILTGCNSSGKSSVIKAMMLLNNFFEQIMFDFKKGNIQALENYHLNFINEFHTLGLFVNAKNKFSKSDVITFSFSKFSALVNADLNVSISFVNDNESKVQGGKLQTIVIKYNNTEVIKYEVSKKTSTLKMQVLKELFIDFTKQAKEYNRQEVLEKEFEKENGSWHDKRNRNLDDYSKRKKEYLLQNNIDETKITNFQNFLMSDLFSINPREYARIFDRNIKYDILFYLPVLDLLNIVNKDDVDIWFKQLVEKYKIVDEYIIKQVNNIIKDFKDSKFDFIVDYYAHYENIYLHNIQYKDDNPQTTYLGRFFKGIYSDSEILTLRSLTLSVNSDWKIVGADNDDEPIWDEVGGEDFDSNERKFKRIFQTFQDLNMIIDEQYKSENIIVNLHGGIDKRAKDFETFLLYLSCFLHDGLINTPSFIQNTHFIGAERVNLQRLYTKESNTEFTKTLFDLIQALDKYKMEVNFYKPFAFTRKWLNKFDIAEDIEIKPVEEGVGIFVRIKKRNEWALLADEGFGVSKLLAILLKIELILILEQIRDSKVVLGEEKDRFLTKELCTFIIEEPESNLHPKLQSMLAELFVELAFDDKNSNGISKLLVDERILNGFNFIIETHSEYLIRKLQNLVALKKIETENISIYYMNSIEGKSQTVKISIEPDGALDKPFGRGFFDEASSNTLELIRLKRQK